MISYFQNNLERPKSGPKNSASKFYYTLTFSYTFKYANDLVYFSYCYPYTYTQLMDDLSSYSYKTKNSNILRVDPLCKTLAGNVCPVLTITESVNTLDS